MKTEAIHNYYLHEMIRHLDIIGESKKGLESIILENIIYKPDGRQSKACDYIGIYYPDLFYTDGYVHLLELKGSKSKVKYATRQLYATKQWVEERMKIPVIRMGVIIYNQGTYERVSVL